MENILMFQFNSYIYACLYMYTSADFYFVECVLIDYQDVIIAIWNKANKQKKYVLQFHFMTVQGRAF